jgi:competence protein ComEA
MYGKSGNKLSFLMIFLGLLCFLVAAVLGYSFKGRFGQDTAGKSSIESAMPVMEDTIDVSANNTPALQRLSSGVQTAQEESSKKWVVYITGSVKKPGVYEIPAGARIYQALEIAGGFSANADQEAVNLAAMLEDGSHIRFPAKGEANVNNAASPAAVQVQTSGTQANKKRSSELININTAGQSDLEQLPGIGPKTALSIINYRDANGGFKRPEDLLLIKGIGAKKYDAIKSLVTVGK